jgi:hypothetical protein
VQAVDRYGRGDVCLAELEHASDTWRQVAQCMVLISCAFVSARDIHRIELYTCKPMIFLVLSSTLSTCLSTVMLRLTL